MTGEQQVDLWRKPRDERGQRAVDRLVADELVVVEHDAQVVGDGGQVVEQRDHGARFATQTERIRAAITRWAPRVFKYGSLVLGALLAADATAFFVRGEALFT